MVAPCRYVSPALSAPSRGNSKYHYYGIRVKPDSPLNRLQEDTQYMAMRQQPVHQKQRSVCSLSRPKACLLPLPHS